MKKNEKKDKMNAVQFMKHFEETQAMMENIANQVAGEQKSLLESQGSDVNAEGIFEMGNLLDVNTLDTEANQPRLYNSPVQPLSDGDKAAVADDFAQMLMNSKADTVDLEQIGPMSTAIGMKHGLVTGVEEFIRELINTAVEKQNSQGIALGQEEVPGLEQVAEETAPAGMPADGVVVAVADPSMDQMTSEPALGADPLAAGDEASALDTPAASELELPGSEDNMDLGNPAAPAPEAAPEMGTEEPASEPALDMPVADMGSEVSPEQVAEEKEHAEKAGELEQMASEKGDEKAADIAADLKEGESKEAAELEEKLGDEGSKETPAEETPVKDEEDEDEEPKLEAQLESIREKYTTNKQVDVKLEAIKKDFLDKQTPVTESTETPAAPVVSETKEEPKAAALEECMGGVTTKPAANTSVMEEVKDESKEPVMEEKKSDAAPMVEEADATSENDVPDTEDLFESAKAQLESIATEYKQAEQARFEAEQKDKELDAKLESIVTGYHEAEKAKVEAVEKETKVTAQLESIAAEYHENNKKAKLESVESRKKAKERIQELTK